MQSWETRSRFAKQELAKRKIISEFRAFVQYTQHNYSMQWFHRCICEKLQLVADGHIKKLMLFVPPQHGKSQIVSRTFPAFLFAKDPSKKVTIASYASSLAGGFNRDVQRLIDSERFRILFPSVRLPVRGEGERNTDKFEIVGSGGFLKSVGVGGGLTGTAVDVGIIDDPIKDRQEAQSLTIRDNVWNWYTDVFETRLHNNSVQVVVQTRWHQDDLSGRLLKRDGHYSYSNPTGWTVINFESLKTANENPDDHRQVGEALWPERHSQTKLEKIRKDNELTFNSLYQGDPKPSSANLVYPNWYQIDSFPTDLDALFYGLDYGFRNDPTAFVRIGRKRNRIYLDELVYERGLTNQDILVRLNALGISHDVEIFADNEAKSNEELRRGTTLKDGRKIAGYNVRDALKGPGTVYAGISKMDEYEVYYTKRSVNIHAEVSNYEWVMAGGAATNEPQDGFDHTLDASRYGVYTKYHKPTRRFGGADNF